MLAMIWYTDERGKLVYRLMDIPPDAEKRDETKSEDDPPHPCSGSTAEVLEACLILSVYASWTARSTI
jgi:hypothetical protein